jgi:hypothetical protein
MEVIELSAIIRGSIWLRRNTIVYGGIHAHPNMGVCFLSTGMRNCK